MVEAIRQFFDKYIKPSDALSPGGPDPVRIATAALLIEMTRMDNSISDVERMRVTRVVQEDFGLSADETAELLRLAEQQAQQATDYFQFTALIKDHMTAEQKERLIEHLWEVAYADGELHQYEEHLVRKIADLLYVPHSTFIAAKLRAKANGDRASRG
jgi:uncharacterized tellurite resistance protein B-like protein